LVFAGRKSERRGRTTIDLFLEKGGGGERGSYLKMRPLLAMEKSWGQQVRRRKEPVRLT